VLLPAIVLYAVHHGLAKGALFLSVGFSKHLSHKRYGPFIWLGILLPVLALAGLPLTSGALAKSALKVSVTDISWLASALPITAIGTTFLMLRFMSLMRDASATAGKDSQLGWAAGAGYTLMLLLSLGILYTLPQAQGFLPALFTGSVLWSALWPFIVGLTLYFGLHRYVARLKPVPAGDIVIIFELLAGYAKRLFSHAGQTLSSRRCALNHYLHIRRAHPLWPKKLLLSGGSINMAHPGIIFIVILLMTTGLLAFG